MQSTISSLSLLGGLRRSWVPFVIHSITVFTRRILLIPKIYPNNCSSFLDYIYTVMSPQPAIYNGVFLAVFVFLVQIMWQTKIADATIGRRLKCNRSVVDIIKSSNL